MTHIPSIQPIHELTNGQLDEDGDLYEMNEVANEFQRVLNVIEKRPWLVNWEEEQQIAGRDYWYERERILQELLRPDMMGL